MPHIPRLIIAGTHSGVGKTTIVTGLLGALKQRGLTVQSYKVGPDYIDPGYHQLASGKVSHNLDTWLIPAEKVMPIFAKTAIGNDLAIVEGVMGLYDGGREGVSSTAAIAKLLKAPVVLVIDAKSMGESAAAIALGYKMYDSKVNLAGVIINRLGSKNHEKMVVDALERLHIPVLGCLHRNEAFTMPERHLGLTPVTEYNGDTMLIALCEQITKQIDLTKIINLAQTAPELLEVVDDATALHKVVSHLRIGVAQDEAFSFYYPESLDTLKMMGAEIIPFSPVHDKKLPEVDGLLFGGGFPEMFVKELAANEEMRQDIHRAAKQGMPIYAECGGFMYLTEKIIDFDGCEYEMVGTIPASCSMQSKLQTVGYVEATALTDNALCMAGDCIRGHEFHFSMMNRDENVEDFPWAFEFKKARTGAITLGGYAKDNILASYLHMHFAGNAKAAARFIQICKDYQQRQ